MNRILALLISGLIWMGVVFADEAPISGTVKAIDPVAQTVTLETTAKGKTREVTVDIKPASRIVRFTRSAELGKSGFVEQAASLGDLKPGWVVSVTTKHEGGREVADIVKVVLER
jgi:hypothetical protein